MKKYRRLIKNHISLGSIRQIIFSPWLAVKLPNYFSKLFAYRHMERKTLERNTTLRFYPCFDDDEKYQPVSYYFYQDCWAARQVFREKPSYVVDVGSTRLLVGIMSQFIPCISLDIRPIQAELEGLTILLGSILEMPFRDNEVPCLTTLCVLEHIGLRRYGDKLNPRGTLDAVKEISRVVAPEGVVVYSVPVGYERTEFNAHRRFPYGQAVCLFKGWELLDSCILTPRPENVTSEADILRLEDPVACFCVRKPGG